MKALFIGVFLLAIFSVNAQHFKPWDMVGCDSSHYNQAVRKRNLDSALCSTKSIVPAALYDKFIISMLYPLQAYPLGSDSIKNYFTTTFKTTTYNTTYPTLDSVVLYWLTDFSK